MALKKVIKALLLEGGDLLYKDANLNLYWSHALDQLPHFSAPLSRLPGPKHPLFPHLSTHVKIYWHWRYQHAADSSSVGHT